MTNTEWSEIERKVAQEAFEKAYERETHALIKEVRSQANAITEISDMWRLHDFLSARRHEIDGKYDYSYSALIFVFAKLIQQGWLHLEELEGVSKEKITKISALARTI